MYNKGSALRALPSPSARAATGSGRSTLHPTLQRQLSEELEWMYWGIKANFNRFKFGTFNGHEPGEFPNIQMLQIAPPDIPLQLQQPEVFQIVFK